MVNGFNLSLYGIHCFVLADLDRTESQK